MFKVQGYKQQELERYLGKKVHTKRSVQL